MATPGDIIRRKSILPSELRSREWENDRVDGQLWERAFTMSGTTKYEALEANRKLSAAVADGSVSMTEARRAVRDELRKQNYQPPPGLAGTVKDLMTPARMNITLATNVDMARGFGDHRQLVGNTDYPAQELYRNRYSKEERDWPTRWAEAAAAVGFEGVAPSGMIALNDSPIWATLSRFGTPYPPFDYNSGMWTRPVKRRVAVELGIFGDEDRERMESQQLESFNQDVEFKPSITEQEWKDELARQLQGIAEWRGDTLVMIDRNGSRPYEADDIGRVITQPAADYLPDELKHNYQAEALLEFLASPESFGTNPPPGTVRAGLDIIQDAEMFLSRILPDARIPKLHTSAALDLDTIRTSLESGIFTLPRTRLGWIATPEPGENTGNVRLVINEAKTARRIDKAAQAVGLDAAPGTHVVTGGTSYRLQDINADNDEITITLSEL